MPDIPNIDAWATEEICKPVYYLNVGYEWARFACSLLILYNDICDVILKMCMLKRGGIPCEKKVWMIRPRQISFNRSLREPRTWKRQLKQRFRIPPFFGWAASERTNLVRVWLSSFDVLSIVAGNGPGTQTGVLESLWVHTCRHVWEWACEWLYQETGEDFSSHDKMLDDALLHGQLQEGLRQHLMEAPAVSGAPTYSVLCCATKNEERHQAELKKRKQYQGEHWP